MPYPGLCWGYLPLSLDGILVHSRLSQHFVRFPYYYYIQISFLKTRLFRTVFCVAWNWTCKHKMQILKSCQGYFSSLDILQPHTKGLLRFQDGGWVQRRPGIFDPRTAGQVLWRRVSIECHVTKYSTICGVFRSVSQGLLRTQLPSWKRSRPWEWGWIFPLTVLCDV